MERLNLDVVPPPSACLKCLQNALSRSWTQGVLYPSYKGSLALTQTTGSIFKWHCFESFFLYLRLYDSSLIRLPRSRAWDEDLAAAAKSIQPCPTLCDPIDSSPPGSPVPGILQARTLEWVAISFSNAWTWKVKVKSLSPVWLLATPWTAAYQAPPSMGFSRQEYWSGLPLPSPW